VKAELEIVNAGSIKPALPRRAAIAAIARYMPMAMVLIAALALRLVVSRLLPYLIHPDEVFQTLEPAHRLVFGTGIVAWEYVVGIRSWLFPGITAGLMLVGRRFGEDPETILFPVKFFMALCSLTPVVCGYLWGVRYGGRAGGIVAALLNAVWVELVYFSTHTLNEVIAGDCLVVALYLAYPGIPVTSRWRLAWAGFAFGLTFAFRFHLALAIAAAMIWVAGPDIRSRDVRGRWLPLLLGALVPVVLAGLLDAVTWSTPFQSIWLNFWVNVVDNVGSSFGTSPWYKLIGFEVIFWGGATALILLAALAGARRLPLLLVVASIIFVTHSLIPHKEYRFISPAVPLITCLAGVATAELIARLRRMPFGPFGQYGIPIFAASFWAVTSLAIAVTPSYVALLQRTKAALAAFRLISQDRLICGVGLVGVPWSLTPGQSYLPPRVLLYQVIVDKSFAVQQVAFNAVLAEDGAIISDASFAKERCFADGDVWLNQRPALCVWKRDGTCTEGAVNLPEAKFPEPLIGRRGGG
jgi:GPI mannosyltransferase 3